MKKLNKVMSVLLTLAVVASMFVVGAPASAATVDAAYPVQDKPVEQAWYGFPLPATYTYVVSGNPADFPNYEDNSVQFNSIIKMIYNLGETDIYALAEIVVGVNPDADGVPTETATTLGIFKSDNKGKTWTRLLTGSEEAIRANYEESEGCADIVASTVASTDVFFTDGYNFYVTRDGGETWKIIRNLYNDFDDETPVKTIDYIYNQGAEVLYVGTGEDVYVLEIVSGRVKWEQTFIFEDHGAEPTESSTQVLFVKADATSYAAQQGVMAVINIGEDTILTKRFNQAQWNQTGSKDVRVASSTDVVGASVWLPEDYADKGIAYVGLTVSSGFESPLYEVDATTSVNVYVADDPMVLTNVTGYGTSADKTLVIGGAWYGDPSTSTVLHSEDNVAYFEEATVNPIGVDRAYVLLLKDYPTAGEALAGTAGGPDCGVSYSDDFCDTFVQVSMIGEPLGDIIDVAGDIYLLTDGILWRNIKGYWERVRCNVALTTGTALDLEVASDGALYIAEIGATNIYISTNQGLTFKAMQRPYTNAYQGTPKGISAWYPTDASSLIVVDDGKVLSTVDGGSKWVLAKQGYGTVTDLIKVDNVYYAAAVTADAGVATVTLLSSANGATWNGDVVVAGYTADTEPAAYVAYAGAPYVIPSFEIYEDSAMTATPTHFLYIYDAAEEEFFAVPGNHTGNGIVADTYGSGLASEGTGMAYVLESGTVLRYRGTDGTINDISGTVITDVAQIWLTKSGNDNVLWAQNADGVYKYIDTLNTHGDGLKAVVTRARFGYDIKISWNAMDNAYKYVVIASVNPDLVILASEDADYTYDEWTDYEDEAFASSTDLTEFVIEGVGPSEVVYYNVWAIVGGADKKITPHSVYSFAYGAPASPKIGTPLAAPIFLTPNSYVGTALAWGASKVQADNCQITWYDDLPDGYYSGLDFSYVDLAHELQIVKYSENQDYLALLDSAKIISIPAGSYSYTPDLEYETSYAVRVRAVSPDADGEWGVLVFTTDADPATGAGDSSITLTQTEFQFPQVVTVTEHSVDVTAPAVTVPPAQNITLTVPADGGSTSTPVYIWVIIAIGAILCIAVIVLIVRTRRVA